MQSALRVWAADTYRRELGLDPFITFSHEHHPLTNPMLSVQVIPVRLSSAIPMGKARPGDTFCFFSSRLLSALAMLRDLPWQHQWDKEPTLTQRIVLCKEKMFLALLMCIWGRKKV